MSVGVQRALSAYGKQGLEATIESASPGQLVVMLYEGAIKAIHLGKLHMLNGEIPEKGASISKAIAIIDEGLRISLDKEQGGELAENLEALYLYMTGKLFEANLENNPDLLDHVVGLLSDLKEAWESITAAPVVAAPDASAPQAAPDRGTLSYGRA
ncbi:flagellar export chaperone FliS [Chitiniphilus eburneus]|uniref:Flagellar secretion chaperone FliS n=1 Tax=Chitiniphilus eburneus TaxID=2571148 RepID=A0A4V5MQV2_9NEIS|nr:flagellar export chaperone FliS [Chitiniphilus eburneus]TJZ74038.1 flagellar export chaperone FliS [Chitiniphilus eburneus]